MTAASPATRYVEHVMGMPISLALRGRHTDDVVARAAWAEVMTVLHEADRVFSTYRADSPVSRLRRGEIGLEDCPPEVAEVLALGAVAERRSGGGASGAPTSGSARRPGWPRPSCGCPRVA